MIPGPRRGLLGGLKDELANVKLPAANPATVVSGHPRNGKSKPASQPLAKIAGKADSRPERTP